MPDLGADVAHHIDDRSLVFRIDSTKRDRLAERHKGAAAIADRIANQLRDLAAECLLAALHTLSRDHVILEHQIVRHRDRHQLQSADVRIERRRQ